MKRRLLGLLGVVALGLAPFTSTSMSGCGPACPSTNRYVDEGIRWTAGDTRYYQTSTAEGPWLPFDGETYLHLRHGLGVRPQNVQIMLSFNARPLDPGGGGYSFAAGNQGLVVQQDEGEVTIRNNSCASYFIRVIVEATPEVDAATDGG